MRRGAVGDQGTARYTSDHAAQPTRAPAGPSQPVPTVLSADAQDVDVSASSFRLMLIGGGLSGLVAVLCAAVIAAGRAGVGVWIAQLVSGILFIGFLLSARGMLNSRGFLFDRNGFYARTKGEVFGVAWDEISAIGIGTLPWIQHGRPVHPERRQALEFYPADPGFAARHPEWERWRVQERPSMPGLPGERYRFHLPPFSRLSRSLEGAVQTVAPRKWVGQYRRESPAPE
ncbi:hypothetical protein GCM10023222_51890 [Saccharopolyspora cebuensis]